LGSWFAKVVAYVSQLLLLLLVLLLLLLLLSLLLLQVACYASHHVEHAA
jgi:hypothetical protein